MGAYLQVWKPEGPELVPLDAEQVTVGKAATNDVAIPSDRGVSRLHAVLERFSAGWCLRDLGSRNGTFVNGDRMFGERPLRGGDEIRVGQTRLVYRLDEVTPDETATEAAQTAPELTRREREVLVALCRPVLSADLFTEPASIREVAEALFVTEAAVKQHLQRLYDKFGIYADAGRRRVRLANEAIRRGAVSLADLRRQ
jgi:predicted component of type VI protein secretion system